MSTTFEPRLVVTSELLPAPPLYGLRAQIARRVVRRILRDMPVTVRLGDGELYGAPVRCSPSTTRKRSSRGLRTVR
jgi:hypothetical protein